MGFVIAPWVRASVISYLQYNNRLASIKLRVSGGSVCLVSAYAPHSGLAFDVRHDFYNALYEFMGKPKLMDPSTCWVILTRGSMVAGKHTVML